MTDPVVPVPVEPVPPTQVRHPWRATVRTLFAAVVMLAAIAPAIYTAATTNDPQKATGWAALGLAIAGGITRVMALPAVDAFLRRFVPFLAARPETQLERQARRAR